MMISEEGNLKLASYRKESEKAGEETVLHTFLTGSTANVVLITYDRIYVANCGDSRSAMYLSKQVNSAESPMYIELSVDHKPDALTEKARIEGAGGFVANGRINSNLSVSRAFGDFYYKTNFKLLPSQQIVTSVPEVKEFPRPRSLPGQLNFLVMGCDGIWERFEDSSAGLLEFVRCDLELGLGLEGSAKNLLKGLLSRNIIETRGKGCDNMSVIIIQFLR
jgi:serine/threonine protein phosphatase PrpC